MIDLHCHILFGVDDGPRTLDDSIALAKALVADGVKTVVATPHIYDPPLSVAKIYSGIEFLVEEFTKHKISLDILPGGEIHYTVEPSDMRAHSLNGSRYILLEFPHGSFPSAAGEVVYNLRMAGLIPIVAHPERNAGLLRDPEILQPLLEQGALTQLTVGSLVGDFGSPSRQYARYLLKKGMVHFIASDAHDVLKRPPRFTTGFKEAAKILGRDMAQILVFDNPKRVILNRDWLYV